MIAVADSLYLNGAAETSITIAQSFTLFCQAAVMIKYKPDAIAAAIHSTDAPAKVCDQLLQGFGHDVGRNSFLQSSPRSFDQFRITVALRPPLRDNTSR